MVTKKIKTLLSLIVLIPYIPFLNLRVLRMAGDEKVYITTGLEMARHGRWFIQTLADEPNYFKGPFHYFFLRIGLLVFGNNLIAGVWMNALFAVVAALAMYSVGKKFWNESSSFLLGFATALNVGIFSHAFVSQMEVELLTFYALAAFTLSRAKEPNEETYCFFKNDLPFWIIAGLSGWIKSPAHSVLIGMSGIFYWLITNQLWIRIKNLKSWLAVFTGAFVCVAGYIPMLVLDFHNFFETFIIRENIGKPNTNRTWDYVVVPLLHFTLPWTLIILSAIVLSVKNSLKGFTKAARLGLAISLPSILFWCCWGYKGQNYNLPTIPGLLLFSWAYFNGKIPRWSLQVIGALGVLVTFATLAVVLHFWPLPDWWNLNYLIIAFASVILFSLTYLFSDIHHLSRVCFGTILFFIAFAAFITPLGTRELVDLKAFIKEHPQSVYHYDNLEPSIWSEWSRLQLSLHHEIFGLHRLDQIAEATQPGHVVLIHSEFTLNKVLEYWKEHRLPDAKEPQLIPWKRWLTKGKTPSGESRWLDAWKSNNISALERSFTIVYFPE